MRGPSHLILRKRTIIAATLTLIIFTSTISVLMGIGSLPKTMLGSSDVYVLTSKDSNSVLNSRMDAALADQLLAYGFVKNASPEIFAFANINDDAVVVRGADFDQFMSVEKATLMSGRLPSGFSESLIGYRLADRLGIRIGDRLPLVGSYDPSVCEAKIVGILRADSGVADELIVSLPLARCMSGISIDHVSIIRVTGNLTYLNEVFAPGSARFSISDLMIAETEVGIGSNLHVTLKVTNWGDVDGQTHIYVSDSKWLRPIFQTTVNLSAESSTIISMNCTFSEPGVHNIIATLPGTFPQNLSGKVLVRNPFLVLIAPEKTAQYHNFTVQVLSNKFSPITGARVDVNSISYLTNSTGYCIINQTLAPGNYDVVASAPGYERNNASVEVINSSSLPQTIQTEIFKLIINPDIVKVKENCSITFYFENFGNVSGTAPVVLYLDGNLFYRRSFYLEPLEVKAVFLNVSFSSAGDRTFTGDSVSETLTVETAYQINPGLVQFLLRFGGTGSLDPSRGNLVYSTAKISEGNILIVLVSLAVLTGTLVTLGISISFMKEINDNMRVIGILRTIGASSRQLLAIIFKQALLLSLPAAALGLIGGVLLADFISMSGQLIAFGHLIQPVLDPNFLILAGIGSIAICIGSSLIAGISVSRRVAIRMIKGLKSQMAQQPTLRELLGDE